MENGSVRIGGKYPQNTNALMAPGAVQVPFFHVQLNVQTDLAVSHQRRGVLPTATAVSFGARPPTPQVSCN